MTLSRAVEASVSSVVPGMQAVQVDAPVSRLVSRPLGHCVHVLVA